MFKEIRGLEYALEILQAFTANPGKHDSKTIHDFIKKAGRIDASLSYLQKIMPRMVKLNLLMSNEGGYSLIRSVDAITVADLLDLCDMPFENSPLYDFCKKLKQIATYPLSEFHDFS